MAQRPNLTLVVDRAVEKTDARLKSGGGGGTFDRMEARVAKLESDMGHALGTLGEIKSDVRDIKRDNRTDFRLLFGAIITVALGLAGLMARGFGWI